ncbi:MAG: arginine deiminase [Streptococcaceae bacterium]|nr:arginine deiminase [Streptococcaceae bacterium]MCL2681360.1 arginine deiminase [Streptococcaceae bacterium]
MTENGIQVNSEIGKLKSVLLHRPGAEVENITPDTMNQLLFDDIPYLKIAQKEHDYFAQTLKDAGTEVLYIENLATEAFDTSADVKKEFLNRLLVEAGYRQGKTFDALSEYFISMNTKDMVDKIYAGVRKKELDIKRTLLSDMAGSDAENYFYLNPLPNAYFTRDPQASMGVGMTINKMTFPARQPESLITEYVMAHHPRFKDTPIWRDRNHTTRIEGGDELVLNKHTVAIGVSERTSSKSIQALAKELFDNPLSTFDQVLAVEIPHNHAMMHLDTVFTMINHDQFTVFPGIMDGAGNINVFILRPGKGDEIEIEHLTDLKSALKKALNLSELDLIECGDGDPIVAPREQWNDGSNTLAIAPGEIVTYDRNYVTIELLKKHGIKVHEILSSELARGRGGARCMSQPIWRDEI